MLVAPESLEELNSSSTCSIPLVLIVLSSFCSASHVLLLKGTVLSFCLPIVDDSSPNGNLVSIFSSCYCNVYECSASSLDVLGRQGSYS